MIQLPLVERAPFPVGGDEEGLEAGRLDGSAEVVGHEGGDLGDPVGVLEHVLEGNCPLKDPVQLLYVAHPFEVGQGEELPLKGLPVDEEVVWGEGVMEGYGGAVLYRLPDGVLVEIALRSSPPKVTKVPLPWAVLSMGVPVKPR